MIRRCTTRLTDWGEVRNDEDGTLVYVIAGSMGEKKIDRLCPSANSRFGIKTVCKLLQDGHSEPIINYGFATIPKVTGCDWTPQRGAYDGRIL